MVDRLRTVGVVDASTLEAMAVQLDAMAGCVTLVEWRVDLWEPVQAMLSNRLDRLEVWRTLDDGVAMLRARELPWVLTCRRCQDGGGWPDERDVERLAWLATCVARWEPTYVDMEQDVDPGWVQANVLCVPSVRWVRSYHDMTPKVWTAARLDAAMATLRHPRVFLHKLVVTPRSAVDGARLLQALGRRGQERWVLHGLGADAVWTRVMGAYRGNHWTYVVGPTTSSSGALDREGLGLLDLEAWSRYTDGRERHPPASVRGYGLLGDPVTHSIGHRFHNAAFAREGRPAVYVKVRLPADHVPQFFEALPGLGFDGWSVTMPLKRTIRGVINHPKSRGPLNTLGAVGRSEQGAWWGRNTDGVGACEALEAVTSLRGKHVWLLGAGGTAEALCEALVERGIASLSVVNRRLARLDPWWSSMALTQRQAWALEDAPATTLPCDVAITTLPASVWSSPHDAWLPWLQRLTPQVWMDVNLQPAPWLDNLRAQGVVVVTGEAMFIAQAVWQRRLWFENVAG